ncbi:MAG: thioredoxin family protein, partial [Pseudomonadota bacterium]
DPPQASFAWGILLIAFFGGLILNIMPCVLPVLALKLAEILYTEKHAALTGIRVQFLATSAGIISFFGILAVIMIAVRAVGDPLGWGWQFQQPGFIIFMMVVLTIFALSLLDFLVITLPGFLTKPLSFVPHHPGIRSYLQGMFVTLLATPCSAPFVGTALSFALSRGSYEIVMIFMAMGVGLCVPYLFVSLVPQSLRLLPSPGAWMKHLRRILAVMLLLSIAWLFSILWWQVAAIYVWGVLLGLALLTIALISHKKTAKWLVFASLALFIIAQGGARETQTKSRDDRGIAWQAFAPKTIADLVAEGNTVLVDITAEWCITCLLNKRLVLDNPELVAMIAANNVIAMRGNWTNPNDTIAQYLFAQNRFGIPFTAIYGPKTPQGEIMPELLGLEGVMTSLRHASAK